MSLGYAEKLSYREDLGGSLGTKEIHDPPSEVRCYAAPHLFVLPLLAWRPHLGNPAKILDSLACRFSLCCIHFHDRQQGTIS